MHQLVLEDGTLNATLGFAAAVDEQGMQLTTSNGRWDFAQLVIAVPGDDEPLVNLNALTIDGPDLNLADRSLVIHDLAVSGGLITTIRELGTGELSVLAHLGKQVQEAEAAEYIRDHMKKPVAAYIAGLSAPKGRRMGHAGAIVSAFGESAQEKVEILKEAGVTIVPTPSSFGEVVEKMIA